MRPRIKDLYLDEECPHCEGDLYMNDVPPRFAPQEGEPEFDEEGYCTNWHKINALVLPCPHCERPLGVGVDENGDPDHVFACRSLKDLRYVNGDF